jgi:hypothetical protein
MLAVVSCGILAAPLRAEVLRGCAPTILTLMTHTDGTYPAGFAQDVIKIEWGIALYGPDVRMNLEASKDFAAADAADTGIFLASVRDRGHGVGTHCNDVRAFDASADLQTIIDTNKAAVDALVGADTNVSISGICTKLEWVQAAANAGFKIAGGAVGLCYLSMPIAERPARWTDARIRSDFFHDPVPFGFDNRISPIRMQDAHDFTPDDPGILTLSNGGIGELASLAEGRRSCPCILDATDLDVVYAAIERVQMLKGPRTVGRINVHVPTTLFVDANRALLDAFMLRLRAYAASNMIVFGTEKDVSDTFDYWRQP